MVINDGRSEEFLAKVTLNETRINRREMNWNSQDAIAVVNDEGTANVTNEDDLVDIARNSCPSVKSVYFSPDVSGPLPSVYEPGKLRIPQRVSNDVETLLKIEQELGPLRYRYSEIIGKARALSLGLDICHPNQPDAFARSVLSPSLSYYFPDCAETRLGRATSVIKNRSGLVDKTSPSSTFSVVGKPTPRGSRISWLNENGSNRRQEALSYIDDEPSRAFECHDGPRFSNRGRNSTSYLPAADSHTFRRENVLDDRSRNVCVSNSNFQPYREPKPVIEKATSARNGRYVREAVNSSSFFNGTEYSSHEYLNRTAENPRTSADNSFEIQRQKSLISIAEVADNNFPIVNERMANERSSKCSSGDPNATAAEFVERGSNYHKSFPSETEHIAKGDQISSSLALRSIDSDASSDHGIRVISTSACAPEIRFVSVNTELRTTVGKRYTNRANSPIQHLPVVSPTTTRPSNVFFNATMSSVFVQQVRTDSSREVTKIESPTKIHSVDAGNQDAPANVTGKRDFCVQKVDSRSAAEDLPRFSKLERNGENSTGEFGKTRYLLRPKEKITIVPIVLADGMSGSSGIADVDFAIPRYAIKTEPKLNYRIISFDGRKLREEQSSSSINDAGYRRDIADPVRLIEEPADEEHSRPGKTHYRRFSRHLYAKVNRLPSATNVTRNPKQSIQIPISNVVGGAREREFGERRVAKTIPGMTSTPEDFLCET
ncbi:uncharacterized protein [Cardiocondyla obscurior]|uniref:uncharacterized protein n=1 Tax=Cardiocondyla obscurior TaxID=286306 RepID=UPI0039657E61